MYIRITFASSGRAVYFMVTGFSSVGEIWTRKQFTHSSEWETGSCKIRKPWDALQTVRWGSLSPETQPIPRKPASTPGVPRLCRPCCRCASACCAAAKTPREGKQERQERQLSIIDMGPVSYTLSVFINKMHSEAHGHQTKHSTGQSLRTAQEAILLQQLCSLQP